MTRDQISLEAELKALYQTLKLLESQQNTGPAIESLKKEIRTREAKLEVGSTLPSSNMAFEDSEAEDSSSPLSKKPLNHYLDYVINTHKYLKLKGILTTGEVMNIGLEEVYVDLTVPQRRSVEDRVFEQEAVSQDQSGSFRKKKVEIPVSIKEILKDEQFLFILGTPGSGKTTILAYLALTFAQDFIRQNSRLAKERLGLDDQFMPIFLPLREFALVLQSRSKADIDEPKILVECLHDYFSTQKIILAKDFFSNALETGNCIFLFDGLDEIPHSDIQTEMGQLIESFVRHFPSNRYIITSRKEGYRTEILSEEELTTVTLRHFDDMAISEFLIKWSLAVETRVHGKRNPTIERIATDRARGLIEAIQVEPHLRELAVSPLLLTAIALIHWNGVELPEHRAELYEECIKVLLGRWDAAKELTKKAKVFDWARGQRDKEEILGLIALWMHEHELHEIKSADMVSLICDHFEGISEDWYEINHLAKTLINNIIERSGLLIEAETGIYKFSH